MTARPEDVRKFLLGERAFLGETCPKGEIGSYSKYWLSIAQAAGCTGGTAGLDPGESPCIPALGRGSAKHLRLVGAPAEGG